MSKEYPPICQDLNIEPSSPNKLFYIFSTTTTIYPTSKSSQTTYQWPAIFARTNWIYIRLSYLKTFKHIFLMNLSTRTDQRGRENGQNSPVEWETKQEQGPQSLAVLWNQAMVAASEVEGQKVLRIPGDDQANTLNENGKEYGLWQHITTEHWWRTKNLWNLKTSWSI